MSNENTIFEVLPKIGFLFEDDSPTSIVCKPKLMPLKTVTLEKVTVFVNFFELFNFHRITKFFIS